MDIGIDDNPAIFALWYTVFRYVRERRDQLLLQLYDITFARFEEAIYFWCISKQVAWFDSTMNSGSKELFGSAGWVDIRISNFYANIFFVLRKYSAQTHSLFILKEKVTSRPTAHSQSFFLTSVKNCFAISLQNFTSFFVLKKCLRKSRWVFPNEERSLELCLARW